MSNLQTYLKTWKNFDTLNLIRDAEYHDALLEDDLLIFSLILLESNKLSNFGLRKSKFLYDLFINYNIDETNLPGIQIFLLILASTSESGHIRLTLETNSERPFDFNRLFNDCLQILILQNENTENDGYDFLLNSVFNNKTYFLNLINKLNSNLFKHFIKPLHDHLFDSIFHSSKNNSKLRTALPLVYIQSDTKFYFYYHLLYTAEANIKEIIKERIAKINHKNNDIKTSHLLKKVLNEVLDTYTLRTGTDESSQYYMNTRQQVAVAIACLQETSIITGGPGTGKTSVVVQILRALVRLDQSYLEHIAVCAPTGRAAARLQESINNGLNGLQYYSEYKNLSLDQSLSNLKGSTVHRLLNYNSKDATFKYHSENPLPFKLVIVDEVSMLDIHLFSALLQALSKDTRLILLGDRNQLPSVDSGCVLGDFTDQFYQEELGSLSNNMQDYINSILPKIANNITKELSIVTNKKHIFMNKMVILTESHRSEKSILKLAETINKEDVEKTLSLINQFPLDITKEDWPVPILELNKKVCKPSGVRLLKEIDQDDSLPRRDYFIKIIHRWVNSHYIGEKNLFREDLQYSTIDSAIQKINEHQDNGELPIFIDPDNPLYKDFLRLQVGLDEAKILTVTREGFTGANDINKTIQDYIILKKKLKRGPNSLYSGLPIMITRNAKELNLFNGDTGIIIGHKNNFSVVFQRVNGFEIFPFYKLPDWKPAYAITVHKSQGSEYEHILFVLPEKRNPLMTREILYTAITRSKYFVGILGDSLLFSQSVNYCIERDSGIPQFLDHLGSNK